MQQGSKASRPEPGDVVLYDYWRSSASFRVRIALALKAIPYRRVAVDLLTGEHRQAAHRARNPQGLVPALSIDGVTLTQSVAIIEYLDDTRPEPALLPAEAQARAQVRALAMAVACEIHPLSNPSVLTRVEALAGSEARAEWNRENIRSGLESVEAMLEQSAGEKAGVYPQFCHGDAPGLADCLLYPQLYNATRWGVSFDHLPRINSIAGNCAIHPAFTAARPENFDPSAN